MFVIDRDSAIGESGKAAAAVLGNELVNGTTAADEEHIIAMREGSLLHQGTPAELMHTEVLREIYDIDIRIENISGNRIGIYFA